MLTGKYFQVDGQPWVTVELMLDGDFELALKMNFTLDYCEPFQAVIKLSEVPLEQIGWENFQNYLEKRFVLPRLEELKEKGKDCWRMDFPDPANITMAVRIRSKQVAPCLGLLDD